MQNLGFVQLSRKRSVLVHAWRMLHDDVVQILDHFLLEAWIFQQSQQVSRTRFVCQDDEPMPMQTSSALFLRIKVQSTDAAEDP